MPQAPRIKICGITSLGDAQLAVDAGAWAIGLIFWPGSPRRCELPEAERIVAHLRRTVEICGVFVDAPVEEVIAVAEGVGLSMVQLHGSEGPAYCREVQRRAGVKVIKAARVRYGSDVLDLEANRTDFHLLDSYAVSAPGGTGETWDWSLLAGRRSPVRLILSGGLDADNVGEAIAMTRPFAVDVASGTEASPGVKDPAKITAFVAAVLATGDPIEPDDPGDLAEPVEQGRAASETEPGEDAGVVAAPEVQA